MNLNELKLALGTNIINFKQAEDENGTFTDWFKSWDNSTRTRIIAHRDVLKVLATSNNLEVKAENKVSGSGRPYTQYTLIEVEPFQGEVMVF